MRHLLFTFTLLLQYSIVQSGPVTSCSLQAGCFSLTYSQKSTGPCISGSNTCAYEVCISFDTSRSGCDKAGGTISHGCFSSTSGCDSTSSTTYDFSASSGDFYPSGFSSYYKCFDVLPNQNLYFIAKDGNGNCPADLSTSAAATLLAGFPSGSSITCGATSNSLGDSCSGGGNVGKECIWTLRMPACSTTAPAASPAASASRSPSRAPSASPVASPAGSGTCNSILGNVPSKYSYLDTPNSLKCSANQLLSILPPYCTINDQRCGKIVCEGDLPQSTINLMNSLC